MNTFQKQLILGDKCMAELSGQEREGVGKAISPARVSVEEFLATDYTLPRGTQTTDESDEHYCFDCRRWYSGKHECQNPLRR